VRVRSILSIGTQSIEKPLQSPGIMKFSIGWQKRFAKTLKYPALKND
jgi:hypothetical protein